MAEALTRVTVVVWAEDVERVIAEACARLGTGCQERNLSSGRMALDFWVPGDGEGAAVALGEVLRELGAGDEVETAEESDEWRDAMRRHHRPVTIAGRLHLRPPWTRPAPGLLDIEIDPGMAFGTGQHATTRGCLELLTRAPAQGPLLDLGCGSGVLAIAACRLGFAPVTAVDLDPLAIDATVANARVNGVELVAERADVLAGPLDWAPTVTANLMSDLLLELAPRVGPATRRLILSGMPEDEAPEVLAEYERRGFGLHHSLSAGGWTSALVARAGSSRER